MEDWQIRTRSLIGSEAVEILNNSRVIIFGLGGVGGCVAEALCRAGIGSLDIVDGDDFEESNLNRQILSTREVIGKKKTSVAKDRLLAINPGMIIHEYPVFARADELDRFPFSQVDYIVDAIDTITTKAALAKLAEDQHIPAISAMGAGNKLDPLAFRVSDIFSTSVCPLAKAMRRQLKELGVKHLKVVYSQESPYIKQRVPASISYMPAVMGFIIAGEVIKDLLKQKKA